jgi:hypothetical protein
VAITTTQATKQSTIFALFTSPSKYCNMQNDLSITTDIVPNQWKLLFIDRHIANSVDAVLYRPQHCQSQSISWLTVIFPELVSLLYQSDGQMHIS